MDFEQEYKRIYEKLVKQLDKALSDEDFYTKKGAFEKQKKLSLLKQIKKTLEESSTINSAFVSSIEEKYKLSVLDTLARYERLSGNKVLDDFNYIEPKDIIKIKQAYINEMEQASAKYYKSLQTNLDLAERESKKIIGELAKSETADILVGGELKKQAIQNMKQSMLDLGYTNFIYNTEKGARSISLENYAKIQMNSKISYAVNSGITTANEELGNDLVQFSKHFTCCNICSMYAESRVYSTNKNRTDYPYLYDIQGFNKGYMQLHPSCKHRLSAYFEEYVDNAEETKKMSNLPFEDRRTEEQKNRYDNQQKLNVYRLAKRRNIEKRKELAKPLTDKDKSKKKRLEKSSKTLNDNINKLKEEQAKIKIEVKSVEVVKSVKVKKEVVKEIPKEKLVGVEKGKIMTFDEADGLKPNPNFESKDSGYRVNCQTCVVSYEARRRGFNVEALSKTGNATMNRLSIDTDMAWKDRKTGEKPIGMSIISKGTKTTYNFLKDNIKENERYTFSFMWKKGSSGHIIHADRVNGIMRLYDPQSGKLIDKEIDVVRYLEKIKHDIPLTVTMHGNKFKRSESSLYHARPKLLRVDNLDFNMEVVENILKGSV